MSFYHREKSRLADRLKGKSGDDLMREFKRQFEDNNEAFFEPTSSSKKTTKIKRDPFERHTGFSGGFPFDDIEGGRGFGRRGSDIRSHLDDLAARHPEFADHLLDDAWGELPAFSSVPRRRSSRDNRHNRDSGDWPSYPRRSNSRDHQNPEEEDARSHTSGSSASSGASGVNSHRENSSASVKVPVSRPEMKKFPYEDKPDTAENRGQRSMSAPPDNHHDDRRMDETGKHRREHNEETGPNQRYVSRVDITPRIIDEKKDPKASPRQSPLSSSSSSSGNNQDKTTSQKPGSNVRHIPIFVEGRDEPVLPKNHRGGIDETESPPTKFTSGSNFHQMPNFDQYYRVPHQQQQRCRGRSDWPPSFDDEFYARPRNYHRAGVGKHRDPQFPEETPRQSQGHHRHQGQTDEHRANSSSPQEKQQQQSSSRTQHPVTVQAEAGPEIAGARMQKQPRDPLEKVAEVQREVDSLNEQVAKWSGDSRKDKTWIYLDEMLTRELIKLDDIETEGKENVRQARKTAIKSIQDSISMLEAKAPLSTDKALVKEDKTDEKSPIELMDTGREREEPEAIVAVSNEGATRANDEETTVARAPLEKTGDNENFLPTVGNAGIEVAAMPTDDKNVDGHDSAVSLDATADSPDEKTQPEVGALSTVGKTGEDDDAPTMMEIERTKEPETAKKIRRNKRQQQQQQTPITEDAIPLPAPPETREIDAGK